VLSAEHDAHAAHSDDVQDDIAPEFPAEPFGAGSGAPSHADV